ncbi:MAG TPA: nucleotidyltransferase domain-containing protein [Gaiellaceae bacterium]|nr:nucleotidyltransferase domain-containing protein [Gaiellaceae bacterium]
MVAIPIELEGYLDELVDRLRAVAALDAVYLVGSAAQGCYEHGRSDVDVVAVTACPPSQAEKEAFATVAESLPCPARKLELVVYARGTDRHALNVNTDELVHFSPDDDPAFWFVLDRSIAERHSIALLGPPWEDTFAPVPDAAVRAALDEAETFDGWDQPHGAALARIRGEAWRKTGEWLSKAEARRRLS